MLLSKSETGAFLLFFIDIARTVWGFWSVVGAIELSIVSNDPIFKHTKGKKFDW